MNKILLALLCISTTAVAQPAQQAGESLPMACLEDLESPTCKAFLDKAVSQLREWKCRIQQQADTELDMAKCLKANENLSVLDIVESVPDEVTLASDTETVSETNVE